MRYADLRSRFEGCARPSLGQVRQAVLEIRRRKAMVVEAAEPDSRSAGSFFKNPVITREHFGRITEQAAGLRVPGFEVDPGNVEDSGRRGPRSRPAMEW